MLDETNMLGRGLALLEKLTTPKRLSEIAFETQLPKSTIHRILTSLRYDGWVAQNPDSTYRRGWRWMAMSGAIPDGDEINSLIFERMEKFKSLTDCTMGFSYFRGATMLCDLRIQGDHENRVLPEVGEQVPFATSATGRAILSALPDTQMFRLIEQERNHDEFNMTDVMSRIRQARHTGVSSILKERPTEIGEPKPQVTCWAAVIRDDFGHPVGAVSAARVGTFLRSRQNEEIVRNLVSLSRQVTSYFTASTSRVPEVHPLRFDESAIAQGL